MEILLFFCTMIVVFIYLLLIGWIDNQWNEIEEVLLPKDYVAQHEFSIIVPFRNEAASIQACLESVLALDYPRDKYEVIAINDHSDDQGPSIVASMQQVQLVEATNQGKKMALNQAISQAHHPYIITLDADCLVHQDWLKLIDQKLQVSNAKVLVGGVQMEETQTIFGRYQHMELAGTMASIAAGIHSGHYHIANGANFTYPKSLFMEVGGFAGNEMVSSGDDVFLLQKFVKAGAPVAYLKSRRGAVRTNPVSSLGDFLQQRKRWASKTGSYAENRLIVLQGFVFFLACYILSLFSWVPLLFGGFAVMMGGFALFLKGIIDFLFLRKMVAFYWGKKVMKVYPYAILMYLLYIIYMGIVAIMRPKSMWKGRAVKI